MLTAEQNALITRTGPGTPGGDLLRRYWQPVVLREELPPGGAPLPVRILGEDLVLFRDEQGQPGLLGLHCPHRGADLSYGRLEDGGLRCLYHGWLFDRTGQCLEQPGEPAGSTFYQRVRHTAYPCVEANDFILTYMGPGAPPLVPAYEFLQADPDHVLATKILNECNYLQGNEGNIDPQHLSFLHRQLEESDGSSERVPGAAVTSNTAQSRDVAPTIEVEETDYGVRIYSVRKMDADQNYVRISNFVMPNISTFPGVTGGDGFQAHWHVPIDDTHHWKYVINLQRSRPLDKEWLRRMTAMSLGPDYRLRRNMSNRYGQDREEQRTRSFSGIGYNDFQAQDAFATETQGPVQDRTAEHLGTTDRAIILARQMLLRGVQDVQQGREPPHVCRDPAGSDLSRLVVKAEALPSSTDWRTYWQAPGASAAAVGATS
jgi:phenylpropionate dioxygenase-like ring-hydroxylating dioxygenase large terminal subunit